MSIFEDLIEELKEENLLEETVIDVQKDRINTASQQTDGNHTAYFQPENKDTPPEFHPVAEAFTGEENKVFASREIPAEETFFAEEKVAEPKMPVMLADADFVLLFDKEKAQEDDPKTYRKVEKQKAYINEKEYFRKRAMDEVTGLQMVEHVFSGIEREQMKSVPKTYDDLPVKLALHDFLQDAHDANTSEHAQSEFKLMQETENWYTLLSHRDKQITVANLRRYCETTRPALSSQALIALARFYRNSPYTEHVRSKFELVVTRLFSREDDADRRELLLSREEISQQVKELYADWSSIQLYAVNEEDSDILVSIMKFEDFMTEAETTEDFDELISKDFFNRLRMFKEDCRDNFFAPSIVAVAIETNIKIGNRYLYLLGKEKEKFNAETLEEKYGFLHDQVVSDSTGKTLRLISLLHEKGKVEKNEAVEIVQVSVKPIEKTPRRQITKKPRSKIYSVNKWLLAAAILIIGSCIGLYFWAEHQSSETKTSNNVKKVNLENSGFKDYIQTARISQDTFYGVTTAAWEGLNSQKKEEMLKKLQSIGSEKNYKKVHLINLNGKSVGFASDEKAEVYNQ